MIVLRLSPACAYGIVTDIMVAGGGSGNDMLNPSFFSNWDYSLQDQPAVIQNVDFYLSRHAGRSSFANDFVTGTGAFDVITLSARVAGGIDVSVEAFSDAAHTIRLGSMNYTVFGRNILVDSGYQADQIRIVGALPALIEVRGSTQSDSIVFSGAGDYTIDGRFVNFAGGRVGFEEIEAVEINTGGVVNVRQPDAPLTLSGLSRFHAVNVNNSAGATVPEIVIDATGVRGLPLTLNRGLAFIDRFSLKTGIGADNFKVQGNPAALLTRIETGDGNDNITVGAAGRLANMGTVQVLSGVGVDTLTLDDSAEIADRTYGVDRVIFTQLTTTGTTVQLDSEVETAVVHTGKGVNKVNALFLPQTAAVTFDANAISQLSGPTLSPIFGVSLLTWRVRTDGSVMGRINGAVGSLTIATPIGELLTGTGRHHRVGRRRGFRRSD